MLFYSEDAIKGIFLLLLAIAGGFISQTLGCKTQKMLTNNMFAKHFIIILILYFTINFTNNDESMHPFYMIRMVLIIYILFLLFTKMNIQFTIVVFCLLTVAYVNSTFIDYYTKNTPEDKNKIESLQKNQQIIYILIIILIIIGFVLYFHKQYKEHSKSWSTIKFIFGVNNCDSMK